MSTITSKASRNTFQSPSTQPVQNSNGNIMTSKTSVESRKAHTNGYVQENKNTVKPNGPSPKSLDNSISSKKSGLNLEDQFKAACDAIQNLPKNGPFQPSNEMLLKFYGYFKQATSGPSKTSRPSMFKVVERAKWDAWNSVKDLSREEAMQGYIDEIKNIIETMPHNESVDRLVKAIGPFYEFVDENGDIQNENESDDENEENELEIASLNNNKTFNGMDSSQASNGLTNSYDMMTSASFNNINNGNNLELYSNANISSMIISNNNGFDLSKSLITSASTSCNITGDFLNKNEKVNGETLSHGNTSNFNGIILNGNGLHNTLTETNNKNTSDDEDEDEENYCDTSDNLNEHELLIQTIKQQQNAKNNANNHNLNEVESNGDISSNQYIINSAFDKTNAGYFYTKNKNHDFNHNIINGAARSYNNLNGHDFEINSILVNGAIKVNGIGDHRESHHNDRFKSIIDTYGGEVNNPQQMSGNFNSSIQQNAQARQSSRPGSSLSINYGLGGRSSINHGMSGGGGGGYPPPSNPASDSFMMHNDTNRQILLILVRLQQDTNNVLTRLSYLEANIHNIQMNSNMNSNPSAFSVINSPRASSNRSMLSFWYDLFRNIDWKTVSIAIIWPFIIRLVFYLMKKVKLVVKLRRVKR